MSKNTQTTIIGIATVVVTIAQMILQMFGALDPHTAQTTVPLGVAAGVAALGVKSAGA